MPAISEITMFALMHPASEPNVREHASIWLADPVVLVLLIACAGLYALGVQRLWNAAGPGVGIRRWQAGCFAGGCAAMFAALLSPLDAMSAELSSAHMVQHELLMVVAAPLLVVGLPITGLMFAIPRGGRDAVIRVVRTDQVAKVWSFISAPATVWLLHGIALWTWHVPPLYDAALRSDAVHAAEHASFFATAALFWWGVAGGRYGQRGYGIAVIYVFATALHTGLLGAALTFAPSVWYSSYLATTAAWNLTPLEDQQLAGLIMWVPAGCIFTVVGLCFFAGWIRESERRSRFAGLGLSLFIALLAAGQIACTGDVSAQAAAMTGGNPERGREAIHQYGCGTCHTIPGVRTARGRVGPPLEGVASRVYLAGHLPNNPVNMQDWIQRPHSHDPQTVMPETGISAQEARDVAAYLYTLK